MKKVSGKNLCGYACSIGGCRRKGPYNEITKMADTQKAKLEQIICQVKNPF